MERENQRSPYACTEILRSVYRRVVARATEFSAIVMKENVNGITHPEQLDYTKISFRLMRLVTGIPGLNHEMSRKSEMTPSTMVPVRSLVSDCCVPVCSTTTTPLHTGSRFSARKRQCECSLASAHLCNTLRAPSAYPWLCRQAMEFVCK